MRTFTAVVLSTAFVLAGITAAHSQAGQPIDKPAAIGMTPDARASYAAHLRRVFLGDGLDYSVVSEEKRDPRSSLLDTSYYPRLTIWGWLRDPDIYWFITKTNVLKVAKERGFDAVYFSSKGSEGHWIFDVSRSDLPSCDTRHQVCQ